jgi:hypothetical protein
MFAKREDSARANAAQVRDSTPFEFETKSRNPGFPPFFGAWSITRAFPCQRRIFNFCETFRLFAALRGSRNGLPGGESSNGTKTA